MSHEIRTPLNGILGLAELLQLLLVEPEQRELTGLIGQSAHSLMRILNDVLDLSRLEADGMPLVHELFSPHRLLHELSGLFVPMTAPKGLSLELCMQKDVPEECRGDAERIRQVLTNLVGNAVKFTEHGGIVVSVAGLLDEERRMLLMFSVKDTGIGIPKEARAGLFERFWQHDHPTVRKCQGTGLGLAISKQIVELMGGRIWVESAEQEGSVFHFTVPVERTSVIPRDTWGERVSPEDTVPVGPAEEGEGCRRKENTTHSVGMAEMV